MKSCAKPCLFLTCFPVAPCRQGVTLTDLKEAEKSVGKAADAPPRNVQSVSPIVTVTPAERGERRLHDSELCPVLPPHFF